MSSSLSARQIDINGVVQGVGFRPFIFIQARKFHLTGEVSNTDNGVCIIAEGRKENLDHFIDAIDREKPILATIINLSVKKIPAVNRQSFKIVKSTTTRQRTTLISPDVTCCKDCLAELTNPLDRRFEYPFINCTNCGPRYTIIEDIPYDRPKTSMKSFAMCAACQKEYEDPLNRRFHAQPNACPECGPHVYLSDNSGNIIQSDPQEALNNTADYLNQGKIIGIKGIGGFHLACDARNSDAVKRLRKQKNRPHKPFALMARDVNALINHVHISDREKELLESYQSPIVLLPKNNDAGNSKNQEPIATEVASMNNDLGCMLPSTPLHHLILQKGPDILVMTSGNRSGEPLSIENNDALDAFSHIADYFLLHNRDIYFGADDSVTRVMAGKSTFIRRSRGYAPMPVLLDREMPSILGCGAGLKNTVCLTRGSQAFLSPHIGDLDNQKVFNYFRRNIEHLKQILDIQPVLIAHDLHPGYMSSIYALEQNKLTALPVQHHHAHAVSCMAENHLNDPVIAITLDGTGYGTDGHIWGGEILVCTKKSFTRKAQLSYLPMPGGDMAVKEPWRMAASYLYKAHGINFLDMDLPFLQQTELKKLEFIAQMIEKELNSPLTSSAGRLFDAVSSLLCIRHSVSYESQAAMELEAIAGQERKHLYDFHISPFEINPGSSHEDNQNSSDLETLYEIDMIPAIMQIVEDIRGNISTATISADFHNTVTAAFSRTAEKISSETGITDIVLSGGVFNNKKIVEKMVRSLEKSELKVHSHSIVPTGDGGISLGQVVAAAEIKES